MPVFSLLSIAYLELAPKFLAKCESMTPSTQMDEPQSNSVVSLVHHPWAVLALETSNVLFYFSGFVALAVFLNKLLFCRGAVCSSARAATVFSSFEFALWAATSFFTIKDAMKGGFLGIRLGRKGSTQGNMQFQQGNAQMKEAAMAA